MNIIKTLVLASALLISSTAFALTSPAQIAAWLDEGKFNQAEVALKEVEAVKNTAKVHYMLAETYQRMNKLDLATQELDTADSMNPGHTYTSNDRYNQVAASIRGVPLTPTVSAPYVGVTSPPPDNSGFFKVVIAFFILLVVGLLGWFGYQAFASSREKKQQLADALDTLHAKASLLVQDINKAILEEKTSATPSDTKLSSLQYVSTKALNVFERSKNCLGNDADEISKMINECIDLRSAMESVVSGATFTSPADVDKAVCVAEQTRIKQDEVAAPTSDWSRSTRYSSSIAPPPPPQTIVVNSGSSGSLTDVLVASTLINEIDRSSDREERREEREDTSGWGSSSRSDDSDSGSSSDWGSSSSDSGSSSDWGSSSSDSGSSSDWGSSSSDSGSSSDW